MWGVIARIAAAAVVITVVQHHVTQVYNAWQGEREASEDGPRKLFPRSEAPAGDEKGRGRPGDGISGGGGSEGGARELQHRIRRGSGVGDSPSCAERDERVDWGARLPQTRGLRRGRPETCSASPLHRSTCLSCVNPRSAGTGALHLPEDPRIRARGDARVIGDVSSRIRVVYHHQR